MAYCGLKDWTKAKADGLKCVELNPNFVKGYHRAATAMINLVCFLYSIHRRASLSMLRIF